MFIAKTDKTKYMGFDGEYHQFKDKKNNSLTFVTQAKIIDVQNDVAFILKDNGDIEPTFASTRNKSKDEIEQSYERIFKEEQIPGQLRFTQTGKIVEELRFSQT